LVFALLLVDYAETEENYKKTYLFLCGAIPVIEDTDTVPQLLRRIEKELEW
jgi:hypothetical protein